VDREFDVDYSERAGFLVGKSAALADWKFRKDDREFKKLCARLYQRNWMARERLRNPERLRARLRAWRERNREKIRAQERARRAKKRRPKFIVCVVCRAKKQVRAIIKTGKPARGRSGSGTWY
jgi:hypothetical protein